MTTPAAVNATLPSLMDVVKRRDPNGSAAAIVEMLDAESAILQDAVFIEGNLPTGTRVTQRTGLPSVAWRRLNEGVTASKSRVNQYDETCAILSGISKVDVDLANMAPGGAAAFRLSESKPFLEAMAQEMEASVAYASVAAAPEELNGLVPRFASTTALGGSQIVLCDSAPSASDQTSILLVGWGPHAVHMIYPMGSAAGGITHKDMGEQLTLDSGGTNEFRAYVDMYDWKVGVCVKDYRYMARIANIDATNLAAGTSPVIESMITAYHQVKSGGVKQAFYCNRAVGTYLHLAALNKASSQLTVENFAGKPITTFLGIPIRITDAILSTEAIVS